MNICCRNLLRIFAAAATENVPSISACGCLQQHVVVPVVVVAVHVVVVVGVFSWLLIALKFSDKLTSLVGWRLDTDSHLECGSPA